MQTAVTVITFILIGGVGFLLLLFILINWDYNRRQDRAQELESEFGVAQLLRAKVKIRALKEIGTPECPDGTYSPNQMWLWDRYRLLDQQDQAETALERSMIVETKGYS